MREVCENRLRNIAIQDKSENTLKINKLIKSEILYVLKNYFDVTAESLDVDVSINCDNKYNIAIFATANVVKIVKLFSE